VVEHKQDLVLVAERMVENYMVAEQMLLEKCQVEEAVLVGMVEIVEKLVTLLSLKVVVEVAQVI